MVVKADEEFQINIEMIENNDFDLMPSPISFIGAKLTKWLIYFELGYITNIPIFFIMPSSEIPFNIHSALYFIFLKYSQASKKDFFMQVSRGNGNMRMKLPFIFL